MLALITNAGIARSSPPLQRNSRIAYLTTVPMSGIVFAANSVRLRYQAFLVKGIDA